MGRASGLAWSSTALIGVVTGGITIVLIPGIFAPVDFIRKRSLRIGLRTFFRAELLAKFDGTGWAGFYAVAAGDAVLRIYFSGVGGTAPVRSVV